MRTKSTRASLLESSSTNERPTGAGRRARCAAHNHRDIDPERVHLLEEPLDGPLGERRTFSTRKLVLSDLQRIWKRRPLPVEVDVEEASLRRLDTKIDDHHAIISESEPGSRLVGVRGFWKRMNGLEPSTF